MSIINEEKMIPLLMHQHINKRKSSPGQTAGISVSGSRKNRLNADFLHRQTTEQPVIKEKKDFTKGKPVVKKVILFCSGFCIIAAGLFVSLKSVSGENITFTPLEFPADADIGESLYNSVIPESVREDREYMAGKGTVKILDIRNYKVRKNDTLSGIAKAFGLNVDTIISYNNIKSVQKVIPGMELRIPNTDGITYAIRKGDSLSGIADRYGVSLNSLLDWNNVNSSIIKPGEILFIPGGRLSRYELNKILGTLFIFPTVGKISSPYGWRIHPISGKKDNHNGVDISNSPGTVIKAATDGKIAKTGYNGVYGKYIIIQHENGYQTFYGHLRDILVKKGARVAQGDKIGLMGSTGYVTGSHLHFSIYKNGETVDPLKYIK